MDFDLKNYRILVTGARGTLGSRLTECLVKAQASVVGVGRTVSASGRMPEGDLEFLAGDLFDARFVDKALDRLQDTSHKKLAIFHLAAMGDAKQCADHPKEAFQQNVVVTANLLSRCVKKNITRMIYPSTAYVYAQEKGRLREDALLQPKFVYPLTKLVAEETIQGYSRFCELSCDILRVSNVYGPDSKPNTILGTMLFQSETQKSIFLHDLFPVRDFIYIDDVLEALIRVLLAGDEKGCRVFNLSTGVGTSVGELAKSFCAAKGLPEMIIQCKNRTGKESALVLANDALCHRIGWRPKYSVVQGIKRTLLQRKESAYAQA